jgi:hypothetical protein
MRAAFSILGLLVAVAIVGVIVRHQLQAVAPAAPASAPTGTGSSGLPAEAARTRPQQVKEDVERAVQQGAAARASEADQ